MMFHISKDEIKTLEAFIEMKSDSIKRKNKALSYVNSVSKSLAEAAIKAAEKKGTGSIGISGGVSYNRKIVQSIQRYLYQKDYDLLVHENVPNGDMGIPIGQAFIASKKTYGV